MGEFKNIQSLLKPEEKSEIEDNLPSIKIPESIHCNDVLCKDVQHSIERDNYLLDRMSLTIESSYKTIPMTNPKQSFRRCLPGWKENVEQLRQDSLFWHLVRLSTVGQTMASCSIS